MPNHMCYACLHIKFCDTVYLEFNGGKTWLICEIKEFNSCTFFSWKFQTIMYIDDKPVALFASIKTSNYFLNYNFPIILITSENRCTSLLLDMYIYLLSLKCVDLVSNSMLSYREKAVIFFLCSDCIQFFF